MYHQHGRNVCTPTVRNARVLVAQHDRVRLNSRAEAVGRVNMEGYLTHKKPLPPLGTPYGPGHMLLQGPRGGRLFMSDVPLYSSRRWKALALLRPPGLHTTIMIHNSQTSKLKPQTP